MSYTKLTDFAAKDALLSGNPSKLLRGTEIGAEFDAIESAMAAAEAVNITSPIIAASTSKTTLVDADVLPILDSAAANILKKVTWVNVKATLKTYFDTLYATVGAFAASGANADITSLSGLTNGIVGTSGNQTIAGTKTFSSQPVLPHAPVLSAAISATGTAVNVTSGIPSWINEMSINFVGLSSNGSSNFLVQLRSGSFVTSGYKSGNSSGSGGVTSNSITNAHFLAGNVAAGATFRGSLTLRRHPGNIWIGTSVFTSESSAGFYVGSSEVTLSGDLDGFRITTANGTDTFDAGTFSFTIRE